jgi:hypothetical protein
VTQFTRLIRSSFVVCVVAPACIVAAGGRNAHAQGSAARVSAPSTAAHTTFVPDTLIPRLAMGVRRGVKDSREIAELRDRPGGAIVGRVPLFSAMYVHAEQRLDSQDWVLLASGYAGDKAGTRGWVPRSDIEVFSTRYGYVLHDTGNATEFFPTPATAYAIVPGIGPKGQATPSQSASVLGRPDAAGWQPLRRTDPMPFMELEFDRQSGYPSTTPSIATPYDGRLVRVGVICGGPVDKSVLAKLQSEADRNSAIEMLFVIDETLSMGKYFPGVSDFIRAVGQAAGNGSSKQPRIAVSYYTDGPAGERTTCEALKEKTPQEFKESADKVKNHKQKIPPGNYINPPERMLDGMQDAINKAGFTDGVTSIVVVIGDTGHEPKERVEKERLLKAVAKLVAAQRLLVFFVHVGLEGNAINANRQLFKEDADALRERVGQINKALADRVRYTTASADNLTAELEGLRREADRLVEQAQLMAGRITSRNTNTMPGPALVATMTQNGVTLAQFNDAHQQIYVPSYAWMESPRDAGGNGGSRGRLSRYVCLAAEEQQALAGLLELAQSNVDAGLAVDHDKAVQAFVQSLRAATTGSTAVEAAHANWKKMGPDRTAGGFLNKFLGLDIRAETLFSSSPPGNTEEVADARKALQSLTTVVREASRDKDKFWFDTTTLAP